MGPRPGPHGAGGPDRRRAPRLVDGVVTDLAGGDGADLATGFAARLPLELWGAVLDLPADELPAFAERYWRMQRGTGWETCRLVSTGERRSPNWWRTSNRCSTGGAPTPATTSISAIATLDLGDEPATAADVVATVLEADHETLHGGLANMWCNLLTHPDQFEVVRSDRRQMKFAWLETLRHSPPIHSAQRFARHEVERFGRLLPDGALLELSAAAANRDPRVFADPDAFVVGRRDLCQREPRGQYRADGLPSGIAFGLGTPSVHPAVPKERPPSIYAITRDVAVAASIALLDAFAGHPPGTRRRAHDPQPAPRRDAHLLAPPRHRLTTPASPRHRFSTPFSRTRRYGAGSENRRRVTVNSYSGSGRTQG